MNWNTWVETTFEREWKKHHSDPMQEEHASSEQKLALSKVTFHQKALVATGVITLSALVSGCGSEEVNATAYEECKWEASNGNSYNCDDDDDSFYSSRGYHSKNTVVPSTSKYAKYKASQMSSSSSKGGIGGGGSGFFGG